MDRTERAGYKYRRAGFPAPQKPAIPYPRMEPNLTGISSLDLGNLMSTYAAWKEYTEDLLLHALHKSTQAYEALEYAKAKLLVLTEGKNQREREAKIETNPNIHELKQVYLEADMYREMLSSKLTSIEGSVSVISREITRRGNNYG